MRFGRDAFVVRPASLRERIRTFYALAGKKYASEGRRCDAISSEAAAADAKADTQTGAQGAHADKKSGERQTPPKTGQ